jgi:hypothetical protein
MCASVASWMRREGAGAMQREVMEEGSWVSPRMTILRSGCDCSRMI